MRWIALRPDWQLLSALVCILIVLKILLVHFAGIELHFDEAQYWEWSQQLDWSYYSKGPLIAWLIALSESLFGHGEWQVRIFAWIAHGLFLILIFYFTKAVWQRRSAAWWAVIIALTTPVYFTIGLVMTTDIFVLLFWTWGLWVLYSVYVENRPRAWYQAGLAVGIGGLTKLSIGLLPFFTGILTIFRPEWRRQLANPHLWASLLLVLVCMLPVLIWNANHDWVMFRHEGGHIGHESWSILRALNFVGGQWIALSPIISILLVMAVWRWPAQSQYQLIWLVSITCLAFFIVKSGSAKVQINWPAPCYIGLLVLFAGHVNFFGPVKKSLLIAGLSSSVLLMLLSYFPSWSGIPVDQDPFKKTKLWNQPINQISGAVGNIDFILTHNYHLAGELAFYWPDRIPVYVSGSESRRFNQHDLWPAIDREVGRNGVYIGTHQQPPTELEQAFDTCIPLPDVNATNKKGEILRTFYSYRCERYRAIEWPQPQSY